MQITESLLERVETLQEKRLFYILLALLIALLIFSVTWLVFATGGIKYVYSHLMYAVILIAALVFGGRGGIAAGVVAGLALGPFMPVNVDTGEHQQTANWLFRIGSFVLIGGMAGMMVSNMRDQLRRLRHSALHDVFTGLPNRFFLYDRMAREVACIGDNGRFSLAILSIDNFFEITNTLGMETGENLTRQVFGRLFELLPRNACICQTHSARFAILLPGTIASESEEHLWHVLAGMKNPFQLEGVPAYADASVGLSFLPEVDPDPEKLMQKANIALDRAHKLGQEMVVYDATYDRLSRDRLMLLAEIPSALEAGQFHLHYQPKVNLDSCEVMGVEALLRWQHPVRRSIPPGMFIFDIEGTGLIHNITRWVATAAARQLIAWRREGLKHTVAFNISVRNFQEADLLPFLRRLTEHYDIEPGWMELEITESAVMADTENSLRVLSELKNLGFGLSIDDFGTGNSSLAYLKHLPVDSIKIDQVFIRTLAKDPANATIVRATIAMAKEMGIKTVAEGVEDKSSFNLLHGMGCDIAQGFYLCRPQPSEVLNPWLLLPVEEKNKTFS